MLVEFDYYRSKAVVEMTADGHIKNIKSLITPAGTDAKWSVVKDEVHMRRLTVKAREAMKARANETN